MAQIVPVLRAEIDPARPTEEICGVINAICAFHPGQEDQVLKGVKTAIEVRLKLLEKGEKRNEPVREHPGVSAHQ